MKNKIFVYEKASNYEKCLIFCNKFLLLLIKIVYLKFCKVLTLQKLFFISTIKPAIHQIV